MNCTFQGGTGGQGGRLEWLLCGAPAIFSSARSPGALLPWLCCVLRHTLGTFPAAMSHQNHISTSSESQKYSQITARLHPTEAGSWKGIVITQVQQGWQNNKHPLHLQRFFSSCDIDVRLTHIPGRLVEGLLEGVSHFCSDERSVGKGKVGGCSHGFQVALPLRALDGHARQLAVHQLDLAASQSPI